MQVYLTGTDHKWYMNSIAEIILGNDFRINENGMMNLATKNGSTLYLNYQQYHVSSYAPDEPAKLIMEYRDGGKTSECVSWVTRVENYMDANNAVAQFLEMVPYEI